jgi:cellulose synthase/poly-beta-1,6-N-acetylglucosamine synthase-like glycosyltransferase
MLRYGQGIAHVPPLPAALPFAKLSAISVLVPFRNEAENLPALLKALAAQTFPKSQLELLLIDDHSTDGGAELAANLAHQLGLNCRVLPLANGRPGLPPYKKGAITLGVEAATNPLIACTDADCLPHPQWLARMATPFALNAHLQMLCGPVAIALPLKSKNIFYHFQQTEFAMLVGLGAASLALHCPAMCNGANLAYRHQAFLDVKGYAGNEHQPSGDDEL